MSCYVLYRHVLLFSFTHCRRHSVASVFHCEDLFLHWSSYFPGVKCWSHPIFYGAKYSSHHISSFLPGVNGLSHPIVYGATVQATIIFSSVMGVNCFSHPIFYGANCLSHLVIRSWVLTVLATLFCVVLTVQVTMSFVHGC